MDRGFPGQELKKLLKKIGITASPNCSCNKKARFMDTQGVQWCEENIDTIVEWLREEATKRKLPFIDLGAKIIVKRAIANAKKNIQKLNNKIFVQIASYRDPELISTIEDMLDKAAFPENLVIAIAWQHADEDEWDNLDKYKNDHRFKIIDINYKESRGVCWARNKIQNLYDNEDFTLQLDSHHRFVKNWDKKLIEMLIKLQINNFAKPLLTGYVPSYNPENDPDERVMVPWKMNFDRFAPESPIMPMPGNFEDGDDITKPLPARFYSAHFAFTVGKFCQEVRHDPEYYFHGEEINIAVRAYTHGYDLFHPHEVIVWHEYTRKNKIKQWSDDEDWSTKNLHSYLRNRKFFSMDGEKYVAEEFGQFGFGNKRTLQDYEKYSGISFCNRKVQQYTLDRKPPPNPKLTQEEYDQSFISYFKYCIDIAFDKIPYEDYDVWAVAFEDQNGTELYRQDCLPNEIEMLKKDPDKYYRIWRHFHSDKQPYKWIVWPHSISRGWGEKLQGVI